MPHPMDTHSPASAASAKVAPTARDDVASGNLITQWLAQTRLDESQPVDITAALEELHSSYEELRVAEEELIQQNQALIEVQTTLEEERFRYQELFELAPDGYIVTDANGVIREANLAALQMLRIKGHFLRGKPLVSFISPDDRATFRANLSRLLAESRVTWDARVQPRAGGPVPVRLTVAAAAIHGEYGATLRWLLRDMTERRRAEAALFETNQLLQGLIKASPVAIAILDASDHITLWNPTAERITGWRSDEVAGNIPPGVPPEVSAEFDENGHFLPRPGTRTRTGRAGLETRLTAKDGELIDVELWTAPIEGHDGVNLATVAIAIDISERKRAEQARRELLQRLVTVQEEERARLSREMHDYLGQHLTAIMLGLKSLQDEREAPPLGESRTNVDLAHQLQSLVEQLMMTTHRMAWELRPPELDDIGLEAAVQRYLSHWSERFGIEVDFQNTGYVKHRLTPQMETTLFRVLQEALTNVARHAKARSANVVLKCDDAEGAVIIEDDGHGFTMPSDMGVSERLGITGMRERMTLIGGTLEIESEPGQGTTIYARVPLEKCNRR